MKKKKTLARLIESQLREWFLAGFRLKGFWFPQSRGGERLPKKNCNIRNPWDKALIAISLKLGRFTQKKTIFSLSSSHVSITRPTGGFKTGLRQTSKNKTMPAFYPDLVITTPRRRSLTLLEIFKPSRPLDLYYYFFYYNDGIDRFRGAFQTVLSAPTPRLECWGDSWLPSGSGNNRLGAFTARVRLTCVLMWTDAHVLNQRKKIKRLWLFYFILLETSDFGVNSTTSTTTPSSSLHSQWWTEESYMKVPIVWNDWELWAGWDGEGAGRSEESWTFEQPQLNKHRTCDFRLIQQVHILIRTVYGTRANNHQLRFGDCRTSSLQPKAWMVSHPPKNIIYTQFYPAIAAQVPQPCKIR